MYGAPVSCRTILQETPNPSKNLQAPAFDLKVRSKLLDPQYKGTLRYYRGPFKGSIRIRVL